MAENNTRKDQIIDYDELDELPDVVLGEQTLAMRKLRENGKPVIDTKPKQQCFLQKGRKAYIRHLLPPIIFH